MPLMEDLPSLVPTTIAISLIFILMVSSFMNYLSKSDSIDLHRVALDVAEKYVYQTYGKIREQDATPAFLTVSPPNDVYYFKVDLEWWVSGSKQTRSGNAAQVDYSVVVSLPVLIEDTGQRTHEGKITVAVKKR